MKCFLLVISVFICASDIIAQDNSNNSLSIDVVFNACVDMRDAVAANNLSAIKQSADKLRNCNTANFNTLRAESDSNASLNGHLVFDQAFADSLAQGKNIYQKADVMNRSINHRGQNPNGSILTKTCFVKAGQSAKYTFASKGHQELAVVAESGGLVTMKIHVTNRDGLDVRYDDTNDVKSGQPQRKTSFELPEDKRNIVELEIINCGSKDCSFVVISN